jgi:hypothetical protein
LPFSYHLLVLILVIQGPNLQCFLIRVASHSERLQYIYFNTVLLLRAVARLGPYLSAYDYCSTGTDEDDAETSAKLLNVIAIAQKVGKFDETVLFRGENANVGTICFRCFCSYSLAVIMVDTQARI